MLKSIDGPPLLLQISEVVDPPLLPAEQPQGKWPPPPNFSPSLWFVVAFGFRPHCVTASCSSPHRKVSVARSSWLFLTLQCHWWLFRIRLKIKASSFLGKHRIQWTLEKWIKGPLLTQNLGPLFETPYHMSIPPAWRAVIHVSFASCSPEWLRSKVGLSAWPPMCNLLLGPFILPSYYSRKKCIPVYTRKVCSHP